MQLTTLYYLQQLRRGVLPPSLRALIQKRCHQMLRLVHELAELTGRHVPVNNLLPTTNALKQAGVPLAYCSIACTLSHHMQLVTHSRSTQPGPLSLRRCS